MSEKPPSRRGRRGNPQGRRQAILDAALALFLEAGFGGTTLEHIAAKAGVAKGSIYLYFKSKEELFRALVQSQMSPVIGGAEALLPAFKGSAQDLIRMIAGQFIREVLQSERRLLLRLIITEAPRFPWLAEIYWQEAAGRGIALIRQISKRAQASGEFKSDLLDRFPQLVPAPVLLALLWSMLFERFEPLDVEGLVAAHLNLVFAALEGKNK